MRDDRRSKIDLKPCGRRTFVKGMIAAMGALSGCTQANFEAFLQKHFRELGRQELGSILKRLEAEYAAKYKKKITVAATPPLDGTLFGYGLDLSRCIGCRRCVYACVEENNQSRDPQVHWIRVLEMEKSEGVNLQKADPYYNPAKVPEEDFFYMPVQCQQCRNPPCVKVCPVQATWQEPDGITVVDYNWCIGCRYCMAACPYGARHFNWAEPTIPQHEINTQTEYLGNRPRYKGVVEKCTFCIQRVRKGRYPACVEACPVGARKFGNLLDEQSEIRQVMLRKRVFIFKEELATHPKFYYFYGT